MKIDIHTHILPKNIPAFKKQFGYGGFMGIEHIECNCANMVKDDGTFFRKVKSNCWEPMDRVVEMDQHQVSVQVLSTIPVLFSYFAKPKDGLVVSQYLNDQIAEAVGKCPKRFVGLGTVPMQDPELACREIERIKSLGLKGIEIGSNVDGKNLSEKEFFKVYETLERNDLCLFVHPWNMMGQKEMEKYWLPWLVGMPAESSRAICSFIFGGVFEKFPKLRVAFAHGGGSFPFTLGRISHGFKSRPDLCGIDNKVDPKSYLGKFYVDSLVHDEKALSFIIDAYGEDKICLGTDYPFPLGEDVPGELIRQTKVSSSVKEQLLYKSALSWLNISKEKYE